MDAKLQERLVGGIGTAAIVGAIGAGLVFGLHVDMAAIVDRPLALIRLDVVPPPPPKPPTPPVEQPRRRPAKDAPAPPALRAKAMPVTAPPPVIRLPPPLPMVVAVKPGAGTQATNGASDRPGPGEGAGGRGDGRGGGYGDGEGGGTPPRQTGGRLSYADMPAELRATGTGALIEVRFQVEVDGRVTGCTVTRSSGRPALDAITCRLIERRFRYRPAQDEQGRPVRSIVEEEHRWEVDRSRYARDDGSDD